MTPLKTMVLSPDAVVYVNNSILNKRLDTDDAKVEALYATDHGVVIKMRQRIGSEWQECPETLISWSRISSVAAVAGHSFLPPESVPVEKKRLKAM